MKQKKKSHVHELYPHSLKFESKMGGIFNRPHREEVFIIQSIKLKERRQKIPNTRDWRNKVADKKPAAHIMPQPQPTLPFSSIHQPSTPTALLIMEPNPNFKLQPNQLESSRRPNKIYTYIFTYSVSEPTYAHFN